MAKDSLDEFYKNLDKEYGKSPQDKNIEYVVSLIKQRVKPDGTVDDDIPVPSVRSVAEVIIIIMERPNLTFKQFCEKDRSHKRVIEYLFIRVRNHYDEVEELIKKLLRVSLPGVNPKMILAFLKLWRDINSEYKSSPFLKNILFPERADEILATLHSLTDGEVGRGAALAMCVAKEEGLISSCKFEDITDEFPSIHQKAYNKELAMFSGKGDTHERHKEPIRTLLRSRIGYTKKEDGRVGFTKTSLSLRNLVMPFWRWFMSYFRQR